MNKKHFKCPDERCNSTHFYTTANKPEVFYCLGCEQVFRYDEKTDNYHDVADDYNKALEWSASWIENSARANGNSAVMEFAGIVALSIRAARI